MASADGRGGFVDVAGNFSVTVAVDPETALALAAAISDGSVQIVRSTGVEHTSQGVEPSAEPTPATQ